MMKKIIDKISTHLRKRMHDQVIAAAPWYVGDPCYIIPDPDWREFCELTLTGVGGDRKEGGHVDSVIDWHGQEITIWSNGGDGTWSFTYLESANGRKSFGVDSGMFCVINLNKLPSHETEINDGILFETEPNLYVEDGIVFINDEHDDHHMTCDNWRCGRTIGSEEYLSCGNGCCEGCDSCGKGWECEEE